MGATRFLALLVCGGLSAAAAHGAAIFSTTVFSEFDILAAVTGPPGFGSSTEFGTGSAVFSGTVSGDGVLPATVSSSVSGSASAPPDSLAIATYQAGHFFVIDNSEGLGPIIAPFTFRLVWSVAVSVDNALWELASAGAFFHITGIDNEILTIDGTPVPEFRFHPRVSTELGETGTSGDSTITGTITVPAGVVSAFSVVTGTNGLAGARTPEPASWSLVLGGLGYAWWRRCATR
jgi:hypothetical protein